MVKRSAVTFSKVTRLVLAEFHRGAITGTISNDFRPNFESILFSGICGFANDSFAIETARERLYAENREGFAHVVDKL